MLTDNLEGEYDALLVAPKGLKPSLCDLIQAEIDKEYGTVFARRSGPERREGAR